MSNLDSMRLVHYAADPVGFDPTRVYTQRQRSTFAKPVGFWVSVEGEDDWPSWCRGEEFRLETLVAAHDVHLRAEANIRVVGSVAEFDLFQTEFLRKDRAPWESGIDWPAVVARYDGVIIAPYRWDRRYEANSDWYYGWDCASGCIWNLAAIESVTIAAEAVSK